MLKRLKNIKNIKKKNALLLIIGLIVIATIKFLPSFTAEAYGTWTIGGDGYVGLPTDPSRSQGTGASAYGIGDAFILQPYKLPTYEMKDGRKNMIEDADAFVPRYTLGSVSFVPYDTTEYLKDHSFNSVMVVKRPDVNSTRIYYSKKADYLNSVIKLDKDIQTETSYFKDGVFYSRLKDKTDQWILDNWEDMINNPTNHQTHLDRSEGIWSYITRGTEITGYSMKEYHISERIDDYLHIATLGINPNDMASAKPEAIRELKLRYIDLMMTVFIQIPDSYAEDYWKTAINTYIRGIEGTEENKCNISITAGFMARGYFNDEKGNEHLENIIAGVQDFLDMTIATSENYSLGTQDSANTVEKSLEKAGLKNNYYNRLLESIRLSLIYQKQNNITVNRTYNTDGLWGSNIVSRLTLKKPLIDGTSVTYKTPWSDMARIQNIFLKDYYYGSIIVPAYTGLPSPTFKATIKVESTRKNTPNKTNIEIDDETTLNDSPKLTINLSYGADEAKWKQLFLACEYYKVQVSFKRKPTTPSAEYYKDAYVSEPKTIRKDVLESILLKDDKTKLYEWLDKSLKAVPINSGDKKIYEYEATITIYYSKSSTSLDKMNKVSATTKIAKIKYYKRKDIIITPTPGIVTPTPGVPEEVETAVYASEPDAYSELKEGSIYNETFEAMAGVPTTRNLYFASGGSEFMVEVEVMYDKDKSASRKYESYFAGTECEFKTNDQLKGGTGAYTKAETFVADSTGKTISKSVTAETSKIVTPNGNSSGNITVSGHTSSSTLWAEWTGSISNSTSEPANIGAFTPGQAGSPCAGNAFNPGTQRTKADPTTNWSISSYNTALNQAITWATAMEATNSSFTVQKIADSDGQARIYKVGNAVISVTMNGGSNSYTNTVQPSFSKNGTYTSASASSASVTNSERAVLGSGWGWTAGKLGYGTGYVAGCGHGCTKVWDVVPVTGSGTPGKPGYVAPVTGVPHVHNHVCGTFTPGVDITQGASASISYTIKVTFLNGSLSATNYDGNSSDVTTTTVSGLTGIPAHALCGPCCNHDLPAIKDTWTQKSTFDTLKIVDVRVYKIESSYVNGMKEITYTEDDTIEATIKQGDPNIFYNIAASDTSQDGRLRYSLQQQQHDSVIWYEKNSAGEEKRTNKCNGLSSPLSSSNPVQATGQGHLKSWASGILYNNTLYANDVDHHKAAYSGKKTSITDFATDTIDKQTEEYDRFNTRRNQDNTITVISDMLILQTSSGDQSVIYFDTDQTKKSQENYDDIEVTFSKMWKDNSNSASDWTEDSINIGSYNGKYYDTSGKYTGTGNNAKIQTAFDNDATKVSAGDELGKARVQSSKSFSSGSANKSSPGAGQVRMTRPSALRLYIDNIKQNPINPNGEYFPEQSYVYYKPILSYTSSEATDVANIHEDDIETNDMGDTGYTIMSRYRITDSRDGNVNSIVIHNPVSVQDARIVSLPKEMDQRTTIPIGSANDLLDKLAASEVCPLSPGLCEFRVLNCKYFEESVKASFDFEQINTVTMVENNEDEESVSNGTIAGNQLTFYNFEDNNYGITSKNCTIEYSQNRMIVTVTGKDATIEVPVNISADSISAANIYIGTSAKSKTAKMSWVGANNSMISTTIAPETVNQTMTFDLNASNQWKNADKVSKVAFQLDGDNLGTGVYIISKIEFLEQGVGASSGTMQGSVDDRTIIRSLIKSSAGKVLDYGLTSGFTVTDNEGSFSGFGTGRFFKASGTRIAMNLDELGLSYDEHTTIKLEANVYIPSNSKDNMLFSLGGVGFYIPAGQTYAAFTTGNGVERKVNYNFIGQKMKLGVVFSFGDIKDCDIYINGTKLTDITTVNSSVDITEDVVGANVNIGSWVKNSNYVTSFYLDNLVVVKMPGTKTHTASCYTVIKEHSYQVNYLDELTHVFNYAGEPQTYTAPENGYYKLEAWGAQGGGDANQTKGSHAGLGGYSSGEVYLSKGQTIIINAGSQGTYSSALGTGGGYNGGGNGGPGGYGGGGATDIRMSGVQNLLSDDYKNINNWIKVIPSTNTNGTYNNGEGSFTITTASAWEHYYIPVSTLNGVVYNFSFKYKTKNGVFTNYSDNLGIEVKALTSIPANGDIANNGLGYTVISPVNTVNYKSYSFSFTGNGGTVYLDFNFGDVNDGVTDTVSFKDMKITKDEVIASLDTFINDGSITGDGSAYGPSSPISGQNKIVSYNGDTVTVEKQWLDGWILSNANSPLYGTKSSYFDTVELRLKNDSGGTEQNLLVNIGGSYAYASVYDEAIVSTSTDGFKTYRIPVSKFTNWTNGTIFDIRLDLCNGGSSTGADGTYELDYIKFINSSAGSSDNLIYNSSSSALGKFYTSASYDSGTSKTTISTGEHAIKIAASSQHKAVSLANVFTANHQYVVVFDAWSTAAADVLHVDACPDTLPQKDITVNNKRTTYSFILKSNLSEMNNAYLRFFASGEILTGDVYITNIKVYDTTANLNNKILVAGGGGGADDQTGELLTAPNDGSGGAGGGLVGENASRDGVIITSPESKGVLSIPGLITKTFNGATWARVLYQDISTNTNYFTSSNYLGVNQTGLFSCLNRLEDFKTGGKFEFMLDYPDATGAFANEYNRWKQSSNPLTEQLTNNVGTAADATGFEDIHTGLGTNGGRGLEFNGGSSVLDGSVGFTNWWLCTGIMTTSYAPTNSVSKPYTMPGPISQGVSQVELWVRIDGGTASAIVGGGTGLGGTQTNGYALGQGESVNYATDTGGAGGGYYGGYVTNWYNGGGAGGSSYIAGVQNGSSLSGVNYGNGKVKITQLSHVHSTETCPYEVTHMNSHVHDNSCITDESSELINALMQADQGNFTLLKTLIGDEVYNRLKAPSNILYTWNNWSLTDYKQFYPLNGTSFGINGSNLRLTFTANDPHFGVNTNINAGSVQKIRVYTNINGQTDTSAQLFFNTGSGYNETNSVWASKTGTNGWQWIEFDMASNTSWTGNIKSLRFDLVPYSGGYADINQIQLVGNGSATAGTATSILYSYSGFSSTKKFGITDGPSADTVTYSGGAVVDSGNLSGMEFYLPVSINNIDALQSVRVTMASDVLFTNGTALYFNGVSNPVGGVATANGDGTYSVVYDTSSWSGSLTQIGFDTAGGDVPSGTTRIYKIELIGYGSVTVEPSESYVSGAYTGHIHTQNCIYTPATSTVNYTPVSLTTQHHTSNGGYTAATGSYTWTSNPGDAQRLYNGYNTVNLTSNIGPNRYVQVNLSVGCLTYQGTYSNLMLLINGSWMNVNQAVANGYVISPTVATLYPGYYTPHPYPNNLLSGADVGYSTWNGLNLTFYTGTNATITAIQLYSNYPNYGQTMPGDGIWVNSGALTTTSTSGTWNCNNIPLNTYADLVAPVTPVNRTTGSSGSQSFNNIGAAWQTFTASTAGTYTLEAWGAQGGGANSTGGKGGYSKSVVNLNSGQTVYIAVGGMGTTSYQGIDGGYGYYGGGWPYGGTGCGAGSGGGGLSGVFSSADVLQTNSYVIGGGGGASANAVPSISETPLSTGSMAGGNGYFGWTGSYWYDMGGGGGGYWGGQSVPGDDPRYGYAGTNYSTGTGSTNSYGSNSGDGKVTISWNNVVTYYTGPDYVAPANRQNYTFTPATITYIVPIPVKSTLTASFGSLNGTDAGIQATLVLIANEYAKIPKTINGKENPVFSCANKPNVHKCTDECQEVTILTCNDPHHYGQHYDFDNDICWDACGNDNNHKHSVTEPVTDTTGNEVNYGTFINLDNYFQVYFPNEGDFMGTNEYGIENTTMNRGKGYTNGMNTLEWTREKKVTFGFDVLFNRNGVWEQHTAGEWITLPLRGTSGNELSYYDFYCLLSNKEEIAAGVEFAVEAINLNPSPGGKENPYTGDDDFNVDTFIDAGNNYVTNRERFGNMYAFHSAYRTSYVDVVGRIGNLIMEDTEDLRYANLFKKSTAEDKWIIEGLIHEVDTSISNSYLSWFNNDGTLARDIRGLPVSKDTQMYNTYGTQAWTNKATALPFPLDASKNVIPSLKTEQIKPGYNVLFDISTIGDYRSKVQVVPYFYSLNLDTNTLTPVDVYISMDGGYKPINYFGLMSEYVLPNNTYSNEFYRLKDTLYEYIMNLDWTEEAKRRNYGSEEEKITKYMSMNATEYVRDTFGNVLTSKYLDIPFGNNYALGTLQMLLPSTRARTFIGSSKVTAVNINGGTETNINGGEQGASFINNAQRWHMKLGLPSSVAFVPYRNGIHVDPTDDITLSDGTVCKAFEELERGNTVILMTADIKAIGDTYVLGYDQGNNNGRVVINGKTYNFGSDIPTLIAVYDGTKNSTVDVDFIGTH